MAAIADKFRKKPVVVEAVRLPLEMRSGAAILEWGRIGVWLGTEAKWQLTDGGGVEIKTLEGTMLASPGDWIIRGVKGELYPCKPDIFEATYELAEARSE